MQLPSVLFYLLPPALGAVIGYVTNKIAITMLFRPLTEKRLFGFTIPFTPGIIPRQRYELSANIAAQVSSELFTVETVTAQLRTAGFQQGLAQALRRGAGALVALPVADAAKLLSAGERSASSAASTELARIVWGSFTASPAAGQVGTALIRAVNRALFGYEEGIDEEGGVKQLASGALQRLVDGRRRLGDILTDEVRTTLITALGGVLPGLREVLLEWLDKPATRDELHRRGIQLMRDAVNSMSSLQRLVVIAGQYDRTMEEKMSYLVDRFILSLEESISDPATGERLMAAADNYLLKSGDREIGELLNRERIEKLASLVDGLFSSTNPVASLSRVTLSDVTYYLPRDLTVGDLLGWNNALESSLLPLAAEVVTDLMIRAVPTALEVMNVENLVVNRIDSLDIERVESLLLAVIQKHLKWINFFGALLGAMIGGAQVLLEILRA